MGGKNNKKETKVQADLKQNKQEPQSGDTETSEKTEISFFSDPVLYLSTLFSIIVNATYKLLVVCVRHIVLILIVAFAITMFMTMDGPHAEYRQVMIDVGIFALYWIILGVASSIGLGTGLHTFVLYLGPHIARVTLAANQCNDVPTFLPSRWRFQNFEACDLEQASLKPPVSFWAVYLSVALEAFLWGFGTTIGELPPYFVARAASIAG